MPRRAPVAALLRMPTIPAGICPNRSSRIARASSTQTSTSRAVRPGRLGVYGERAQQEPAAVGDNKEPTTPIEEEGGVGKVAKGSEAQESSASRDASVAEDKGSALIVEAAGGVGSR